MARASSSTGQNFASEAIAARAMVPELAASLHFPNSPQLGQSALDPNESEIAAADFPVFDQRPGELEATRGISSIPVVYGHRADNGRWHVVVSRRGEQLLELTADQARTIGHELQAYAEICDEGNSA